MKNIIKLLISIILILTLSACSTSIEPVKEIDNQIIEETNKIETLRNVSFDNGSGIENSLKEQIKQDEIIKTPINNTKKNETISEQYTNLATSNDIFNAIDTAMNYTE